MGALLEQHQKQLLSFARDSIHSGIETGESLRLELSHLDEDLRNLGASFVTLKIASQLRGCIGSLVAHRPLAVDVVENAFSAAFHDSRFLPVRSDEFPALQYQISVLGKSRAIDFESEEDLLKQLDPFVDGLILRLDEHRATFLPSVWEQLPDRKEFLNHLKAKAGLPIDYWSDAIEVDRYQVESFDSSSF